MTCETRLAVTATICSHLVNKYMDLYQQHPDTLVYKAKAEKYAKIISKTIILSGMDARFLRTERILYDAAEGLLTATILLVAEFCEPEKRHIVSVFKIIQELLAPSQKKGKNQFQQLMEMLPDDHKAKWFAGAALNTAEQSMASVMSTALSRLNSFLDSELEQLLCFDTEIDAEKFCNEKSAIFVVMPEENPNTFFMISLIIQQLYREILAVADEHGGKLKNRCVFFCDEFGTLPKIESAEMMFSASRSRRLQIVPIIQSFSQLDKNYGKEGAEIIVDNTQLTIFGGFAPNSSSQRCYPKPWAVVPSCRDLFPKPKRSFRILADDRATSADTRRAEIPSQRSVRCHENRCASYASQAEAVLQMGHRIRRGQSPMPYPTTAAERYSTPRRRRSWTVSSRNTIPTGSSRISLPRTAVTVSAVRIRQRVRAMSHNRLRPRSPVTRKAAVEPSYERNRLPSKLRLYRNRR